MTALGAGRSSDLLTIHLVAAEESGDRLGAALMRALAQRCGQQAPRQGGTYTACAACVACAACAAHALPHR